MSKLPEREDVSDLGPAMRALDPKARRFVVALFEPGNRSATAAAITAGYGNGKGTSSRKTFGEIAHRVLSRPAVIAAIEEEGRKVVRTLAPTAVRVLREILGNPRHKDRLKAARTVLERVDPSMMQIEHRHDVTIEHKTDAEMNLFVLRWLREIGVSRDVQAKMLGCNSLPELEARLDGNGAMKVIEGRAEPAGE